MKRPKEKSLEHQDREVNNIQTAPNLKGDHSNVAMLTFLYFVQGIPFGLSEAIPILLQNRGVSYSEQAGFTFAYYPFSLKILWAPFVDSVFVKAIGRRKSWLVPTQLLMGVFMIYLAQNVDEWMGDGDTNHRPQMLLLTSVFTMLCFLNATQDISVDGWGLTMLQKKNVGYAGTCNAAGLPGGVFIGYVLFLVLESKEFCNKFIFDEPRDEGLITLSGFLKICGVVFIGITILIAFFKKERPESAEDVESNLDYGIMKAYPMLWKIMKLKPIIKLSLILFTVKASFAACDAVTTLKLIDYGIPRDKVALLSIPLVPVQILLPFFISKLTAGPYPMTLYMKAYPYRLALTVVIGVFVYFTPTMISGMSGEEIPFSYYVYLTVIYLIYQIPLRAMYVADIAFMAKVSDPLVGATYMTLLNTVSNLGGRWVNTFNLWLVDIITWKSCVYSEFANSTVSLTDNRCVDEDAVTECISNGGHCNIDIDGYYIELALNFVYGVIWYQWGKRTVDHLQSVQLKEWHVLKHREDTESPEELAPLGRVKE